MDLTDLTFVLTENQTFAIVPEWPKWLAYSLYTIGSVHLILSLWMVAEYYAVNWAHFNFHGWRAALVPRFVQ